MRGRLSIALALSASAAYAQPVTNPDAVPPLAQIRDEKQLAEALATITQDPAIRVDDEKNRPLAAALMTEGVRQLQAQGYEQALANFLEAYGKFPSPKILLNIGSTLRDMGRLADAANTYQRYLADPATGPERIAEVKELLVKLDQELTVLTLRVFPRGSEVSIDAGPFIPVGSTLQTRVRAGIHLVRVRKGDATTELTINGFEGESKDITTKVEPKAAPSPTPPTNPTNPTPPTNPTAAATPPKPPEPAPDNVDGWLITGRQYATENVSGGERHVLAGYGGPVMRPIVPHYTIEDDGSVTVAPPPSERRITSGVLGVLRVDGKGRGVAGGLGIALSPLDSVELELAGLKAEDWGVYFGMRIRFLTGWLRPYAGGGVPLWFYTDETTMESRIALGLRGAGGVELKLNGHVSIQADVGIEHFFNVKDALVHGKRPDETVFVPTVGVIGRL
ncbi:MAG TPA: tetratricopeptide repeat protein [Kofleriaceae bacterium]|nr:tetratricopeptide repeat protein [Kofleriaceae bacterium]